MKLQIDRRAFTAGLGACVAGCASLPSAPSALPTAELDAIRDRLGADVRVGVGMIDSGNGRLLSYDGGSRYAMCSLFKVPLAAAILARTERSELSLGTEIPFGAEDVLDYAPVVKASLARKSISVGELCAGAVELSDNSAANLLLPLVGGPAGLTQFMRSCGDTVSRLDRLEPQLNTNLPGDVRDTTTPMAMVGLLRSLLVGRILSEQSRQTLISWMINSKTGKGRIRAGLPQGWAVGTKSGTGEGGAVNDSAIFWPPGRAPLLFATFISGGTIAMAQREKAHAEIARLIATSILRA